MKRAEEYSKAAIELASSKLDITSVLTNLKALLQKRGELKLLPTVLKNMLRETTQYEKKHTPHVRLYDKDEIQKFRDLIDKELSEMDTHSDIKLVTDSTVIGGYSITTNQKSIDKTYKKQLLNVYHAVVN